MVVSPIDNDLTKLGKDVRTLNERVSRHRAELDTEKSHNQGLDAIVLDLSHCLEILEGKDTLKEGRIQSPQEEVDLG